MSERWLPRLFQFGFLLVLCAGGWQCRHGWPVSSSLLDLLPRRPADAVEQMAQDRVQAALTRQLIALVGAQTREQAVAQAKALDRQWADSGLFVEVQTDYAPDLDAIRAALLAGRIAMLPDAERHRLETDPAAYAMQRAKELANPFASTGLVPMEQDWLGLTQTIQQALRPVGAMQFDLSSSTLQAEHDGMVWVMLRAETRGDAFDAHSPQRIARLLRQARADLAAQHMSLLAAGGALYADAGRQQAITESTAMGLGSVTGIVLVILLALRRWRALLAFFPALTGLLTGSVACVAVFGAIHVLTLVVGASLIGFVVDFPMHWLGKSYGMADWRAWPVMRRVLPGLSISLLASLVGYLALAFTPFPALTQIAVFSTAGLLGAYACTVCQLPAWFQHWQPNPWPALASAAQAMLTALDALRRRRLFLMAVWICLPAFCVTGILRLDLHDDLRQWLSLPAPLLQQARAIGEITGFMPTSQFFLVRAPDDDALLYRQARVAQALDGMKERHLLDGYLSLSQLTAPADAQRASQTRLAQLAGQPDLWRAFVQTGIPVEVIQNELRTLAALPVMRIDEALAGPQAEAWRSLWLGRHGHESLGLITLQGLREAAPLAAIAAAVPGTVLVDQNDELNRMFTDTRLEAALLKLASYVLAGILLLVTLGRAAAWRILAVPLIAATCTLAALGCLGQPLSLFSLFGLLLVSAIGVDYAVFMYEHIAGHVASLVGILLAAAATLLSFGLLAFSSTPAIAHFGLTVALGIVFSLLAAPWISPFARNPQYYGNT